MLKKILSYGFIEGISKGLNKLTILVLPLFLNTIGYGKIGLLVAIEMIIPVITLLGMERAVLRFYSKKQNFKFFNKTVFTSLLWTHLFVFIILLITRLFGIHTFFGLNIFPDLFLITILVYFQGTNLVKLNALRVEEKHKNYFRGRLFIQVSKFLLVILFVFITKSYLGYLIGAIISASVANIFLKVNKQNYDREYFSKSTFKTLFLFSWPFVFHGLATNLLGNADKFILERFMTLNEVGIYTLAYAIGSTISFAYIGISVFLEPLIYKETNSKKRALLLNKYLFLAISFGLFAYIIISILSVYILPQFYSSKYSLAYQYVPYIASAFLLQPYYFISNYKMIYDKKSLRIATISVISATINIVLNILLIPKYGIYAAVVLTFIAYYLQALLFVLSSNGYKFNKDIIEVFFVGIVLSVGIILKLPFYFIAFLIFILLIYTYLIRIKFEKK